MRLYEIVSYTQKVYLIHITKTRLFKYVLKILQPKQESFRRKILIFFIFLVKT